MRILHAISGIDPRNGGPTAALVSLCTAQVRCGLDVTVVSTWQEDEAFVTARRLEAAGVKVLMIGRAHGKGSRHKDLVKLLDAAVAQADVLHIHALWEEIQHQAARLARARKKPCVVTPHGMLDPWNMRTRTWLKRFYVAWRLRTDINGAAALHFTTQAEADWVARWGFTPATFVESLGLDLSELADPPAPGTFRDAFPAVGKHPLLVYLGRLHRGKGLELLIPAFAQAALDDAMLVIVGPDSFGFEAVARQLVSQHNLEDRVLFTGMLSGKDRVAPLIDARLMALPSYHENFGMAVLEALAVGCPVIVSDQVNLHTEITAARVGGVVPTQVGALAAELKRWWTDEPRRTAASAAARALVRERFDGQHIAANWVKHYQRLAAI